MSEQGSHILEGMITVAEAARELACTPSWVRQLIASGAFGEGKVHRRGRRYYICQQAVKDQLRAVEGE